MTAINTAIMNDPSVPTLKPIIRSLASALRRAPFWSIGISLAIVAVAFAIWLNTDGVVRVFEAAGEVKHIRQELKAAQVAHEHCEEEVAAVKAEVKQLKAKLNITAGP
jgi:cell shape-determining protein MreC